jgi:hypothetical protein
MADDQWRSWTNDEGKKWEFKIDLISLWKKLFGKKEKHHAVDRNHFENHTDDRKIDENSGAGF